jgi:hypothetical protein
VPPRVSVCGGRYVVELETCRPSPGDTRLWETAQITSEAVAQPESGRLFAFAGRRLTPR